MKNKTTFKTTLILLLIAASSAAWARPDSTNRLSVAVHFGSNIKADFNYGVPSFGTPPQTTPDGDAYNYDDGYVLTDVSGNAGGQTWYWGYDDAAQVVGNEILMSSTVTGGASGNQEMDGTVPQTGVDMTYSREFINEEELHFGFECTVGFLPLHFDDTSSFSSVDTTTTDAYGFTGGTTPPAAPYQGTYNGPGFLINASPSSSSTTAAPGAPVRGHSELDATLWTLRIGSHLEFPLNEKLSLGGAGGLSLGWLNVDADWKLTGAVNTRGSSSDSDTLSGMYLGGQLLWRVNDDWRFCAGAEFEYLNDWNQQFGNQTASLDFSRTLYTTLGIQREF